MTAWPGSPECVALSADGRRAILGCSDRTLRVWDLENNVELHKLKGR
jgi:WD40 repeat protein